MGGRPLHIALLPADRFDAAVPELAAVLVDCVQGGASVGFLPSLTAGDAEEFWRAALPGAQARATLLLLTPRPGSDAERFYRRLGWLEVGVVPEHSATPDGRLDATTIMMRRLPPA